jgi:pSer/pThr/pTyr-binding forkhead associated (FHA) protein
VEELPTVSRHHACITEQGGAFYIESLQDRNPLDLVGAQVRAFVKHPLPAGTLIQVGRVWLTFQLIG